jgi:type III pantothenate kinase
MPSPFIVVDVGNARTKVALVRTDPTSNDSSGAIFHSTSVSDPDELVAWARTMELPAEQRLVWRMASVNSNRSHALTTWLATTFPRHQTHNVTHAELPIKSHVKHRERVGIDRLLAAWGVQYELQTAGPFVVIDAGTAVTIDYVDQHGVFQGGNIFPGLGNNLRQLHQSTAQLPEVEIPSAPPFCVGRDTMEAIQSGVFHSQVGGIRYLVEQIGKQNPGVTTVVMTGGLVPLLRSALPTNWRFMPDLVLKAIACLPNEHFRST